MSGEFPVLYSMPETCAVSVLIALKWARADYELRVLRPSELHEPDFLALNPAGQVPAVQAVGEPVMTETHALLLLLADSHPDSRLAPPSSRPIDRYRLERQLAFMTGEVHCAFTPYFRSERYSQAAAEAGVVKDMALRRVRPMLAQLDKALGPNAFLLGDRTVADAFLYVLCRWGHLSEGGLSGMPALERFLVSMEHDPAVIAALADHGMKPLGSGARC